MVDTFESEVDKIKALRVDLTRIQSRLDGLSDVTHSVRDAQGAIAGAMALLYIELDVIDRHSKMYDKQLKEGTVSK